MNKSTPHPTKIKQFNNTLLFTQLLILMSALNTYFLSSGTMVKKQVLELFSFRIDMLLFLVGALIFIPVVKLISKRDMRQATNWYFWLLSILVGCLAVIQGGLNSVSVMWFPIIAIFSAMNSEKRVFLSICAFFSITVIAMTINHELGWFEGAVTLGTARMFDCLILVLLSAYVASILSSDNKQSILKLQQKHNNVIESQHLIQHLADTDSLTGLANRSLARRRFNEAKTKLDPNLEEIGLFFIDLDNFKAVNDLFDHQVGDELLKIIATRLSRLIDDNGTICRLGGDEFVLFITAAKPFEYGNLAKEILISLSEPHMVLGIQTDITASIGITVTNDQNISFDNARKQADMAMYKAKQSGKNDYHYFSDDLQRDYMKNLTILSELKDAMSRDLFDLHYQPKVDIKTNKIIGAEALLRWNRDNPNKLTPGDFIPIIESTELIHAIGSWVVDVACSACSQWHKEGYEISVAVNVSAMQLARVGFYKTVATSLQQSGLPPHFLEIELTEHLLIQENPTIQSQLSDLKKLGVKIAIDDFGTGYSNMGYLTRIEVDTLKLDRSFISEIENSPDSLAIVTAINQMARVLGMNIVAEGVERESERQVLESIDCQMGQGFLWSKALPTNLLMDYLQTKQPAFS